MPKVSVIVPVYNVEKYLSQCLESILAQTLEDIEIICIDDGSTDSSGKILDKYAARDQRVRTLHQPNGGYGAAMNAGLQTASGEYIGIVESDDCIMPEMYETLYNAAVQDDLDLVKSDAVYWIEQAGYFKRIHSQYLENFYDKVLHDEDRNQFFDFFMNIWTGIYKRKFLLDYNISFHESPGASYQDNGFWMQTLLYCKSAKWLNQAFYWYRQDNPEASVKSKSKMTAMTEEYEYLADLMRERKEEVFLPYCYYYRMFRHRGTFFRVGDELKRTFCEQVKKDFSVYKGYIKGNTYLENWFHEIVTRPDEVCQKTIQKKQEIRDRLKQADGIIIYGAGLRGDIVFRGLYNEGYYDKLCCFAISSGAFDRMIAGKELLLIGEACKRYPKALVVIAVVRGSGMYRQMAQTLKELGRDDYIDGTDMEENFYII